MALKKIFNPKTRINELVTGTEFQGPAEVRSDSFVRFAQTDFALNNLFVYDDTDGGDAPLFTLGGSFPFSAIEKFEHAHGNGMEYFPNTEEVQEIEVQMYETADNRAWNHFYAWYNSIKHTNGTYNLPYGDTGFKRDLKVYRVEKISGDWELNEEMQYRKVWGLHYTGVFPIGISDFSPDASDQNVVTWTMRLSADHVEPLTGKDGLLNHFVIPDPQTMYDIARQRAGAGVKKNVENIITQAAENVAKRQIATVAQAAGIPARITSSLTRATDLAAYSLNFSKGRTFITGA